MKCPGHDMQYWESDAIFDVNCPECGADVEFYKDDTTRKCGGCGHRFVNPKMDFGCAAYCKFVEQCIGTLPEEFTGARDNLLKDRVAVEVKRFYNTDFKRIGQVLRVARYAEKIGKLEKANMVIALCTAYLQGIGSGLEEENHNLDAKQTSIARAVEILEKLDADGEIIAAVHQLLEIIDTPRSGELLEGRVINDARVLARVESEQKTAPAAPEQLRDFLAEQLHTDGGRHVAHELFNQQLVN